jgi:bacterioferritin-associated ferredoxin
LRTSIIIKCDCEPISEAALRVDPVQGSAQGLVPAQVAADQERSVYVCNCNGIREREVRAAIDQGAARPADVFRHCQSRPRCAKCVCDMRLMIETQREAGRRAA